MQCKDIPDLPILEFLERMEPANWFGNEFPNSVTHAMPSNTPRKLALAKMKQLIHKQLVDGCDCGCRGDFRLTDKSKSLLVEKKVNNE